MNWWYGREDLVETNNGICVRVFQQNQLKEAMASVPGCLSQDYIETTTGKCAQVIQQIQLQQTMTIVPDPMSKIDCNNHLAGKCALVTEQYQL